MLLDHLIKVGKYVLSNADLLYIKVGKNALNNTDQMYINGGKHALNNTGVLYTKGGNYCTDQQYVKDGNVLECPENPPKSMYKLKNQASAFEYCGQLRGILGPFSGTSKAPSLANFS